MLRGNATKRAESCVFKAFTDVRVHPRSLICAVIFSHLVTLWSLSWASGWHANDKNSSGLSSEYTLCRGRQIAVYLLGSITPRFWNSSLFVGQADLRVRLPGQQTETDGHPWPSE